MAVPSISFDRVATVFVLFLFFRDQRMRELNIFNLSKYNQLGRRVAEHQETMNGLLTDPSLKLVKAKQKQGDEQESEVM